MNERGGSKDRREKGKRFPKGVIFDSARGMLREISVKGSKQTPTQEATLDFRALREAEESLDRTFRAFESGTGLPESYIHYQTVIADLRDTITKKLGKKGRRSDDYRNAYEQACRLDAERYRR